MTPSPQSSSPTPLQRAAAEISARLAQAGKDPRDLAAYLRLHAEVVVQILQPVGLAYEMISGTAFQRAFAYNHESLKLRESPAQELALQRAVRNTAEKGQITFLDANSVPESLHGLQPEDAPAPENLPPYNKTPFQQVFAPITLNKKVSGVLHAWFTPGDAKVVQARAAILGHATAELENYLKARRVSDLTQDLSRISTYAHFLEDVAGDQDLESVSWKLVNYAREAVGCDRVCLLIDSRYGISGTNDLPLSDRLVLQACSGLRKPHGRSEHAEVLKAHASELLKLAVAPTPAASATTPPVAPGQGNGTATEPAPDTKPNATPAEKAPAADKTAPDNRPRVRIMFTTRDPAKVATRPDAVNRYFEVIPMNWSTVIPLYDRENRVCATLLFEGQQSDDKMAALFVQMRDLAVSGGRALSTALVWNRRRTLKIARKMMTWRDAFLATSNRRLMAKYGIPVVLAIALLAFPFPHRVRGDATLRPTKIHSVAALTSGRLIEINAREGDRVTKGQVLAVLDSDDLQLQLRLAQQDQERARTESQVALRQDRSESGMRLADLRAESSKLTAERIQRDIARAVIQAPFDGILVGPSDLAQRRGQVVRVGETVAEIVDPSQWEVRVSIREKDMPALIAEVKERRESDPKGAVQGELVLLADPNRFYPLNLNDPAAFAHRLDTTGGNYHFSAILPMTGAISDPSRLSPEAGMKLGYTGRVRFYCGKRPLVRILFGEFVQFVKLYFF